MMLFEKINYICNCYGLKQQTSEIINDCVILNALKIIDEIELKCLMQMSENVLNYLLDHGGKVLIYTTETNRDEYSKDSNNTKYSI